MSIDFTNKRVINFEFANRSDENDTREILCNVFSHFFSQECFPKKAIRVGEDHVLMESLPFLEKCGFIDDDPSYKDISLFDVYHSKILWSRGEIINVVSVRNPQPTSRKVSVNLYSEAQTLEVSYAYTDEFRYRNDPEELPETTQGSLNLIAHLCLVYDLSEKKINNYRFSLEEVNDVIGKKVDIAVNYEDGICSFVGDGKNLKSAR